MKQSGLLQKQILEEKIKNINVSLEQIMKKESILLAEKGKQVEKLRSLQKTLENFGKSSKETETSNKEETEKKENFAEKPRLMSTMTAQELKELPPFSLADTDRFINDIEYIESR